MGASRKTLRSLASEEWREAAQTEGRQMVSMGHGRGGGLDAEKA